MNVAELSISDQDIESLARKLAEFTQALSPGERVAFEVIEQQFVGLVDAEEMDVSGYAFTGLETLGADAHRADLPRQAGGRRAPEDAREFWRAVIAGLAGRRR